MTTQAIDKLAEFCRLSERGYTRDTLGWCHWDGDHLCEAFDPFASDDDCRMVLEECRQRGMMNDLNGVLWDQYMHLDITETYQYEYGSWLLLATPDMKCNAILKVLGETNDHARD